MEIALPSLDGLLRRTLRGDFMPRKQRFKPSRKPKPNLPSEDRVLGNPTSGAPAHSEPAGVPGTSQTHEQGVPSTEDARPY